MIFRDFSIKGACIATNNKYPHRDVELTIKYECAVQRKGSHRIYNLGVNRISCFYNIDRYELVKIVKEVGRVREKEYSKD